MEESLNTSIEFESKRINELEQKVKELEKIANLVAQTDTGLLTTVKNWTSLRDSADETTSESVASLRIRLKIAWHSPPRCSRTILEFKMSNLSVLIGMDPRHLVVPSICVSSLTVIRTKSMSSANNERPWMMLHISMSRITQSRTCRTMGFWCIQRI